MATMKRLALFAAALSSTALAHPVGDPIPEAFHGVYARSSAACDDADEIALLAVTGNRLQDYEGGEYLVLGIEYSGSIEPSYDLVPKFNGRFLVRAETAIGEVDLQLVMETPNRLVRRPLSDAPVVDSSLDDRWYRCSAATLHGRQATE